MTIDRRSLLECVAALPLAAAVPGLAAARENLNEKADYTLRIGIGLVEFIARTSLPRCTTDSFPARSSG
jgi:hypothetical protein